MRVVTTTTIMKIEKMTADEVIEALEELYEAIPKWIWLIKLNQHPGLNKTVDAVDVTDVPEDQDTHHTLLRPF